MEIVSRAESQPVLGDVLAGGVDVVVLGVEDSESILVLLEACPRMAVVGVVADGRAAFLYRTRPEQSSLGELSPDNLVGAIRDAARTTWSFQTAAEAPESTEG